MKLPCFNLILKNYKRCARLFTVWVFTLSFFLPTSAAVADDATQSMIANDIQRILELLNSQDTYLDQSLNHNGDLASLSTWQQEIAYLISGQNQPQFSQFHNWYSSDHTLYSQLKALKSAIQSLASASPPSVNVAVTNVVGDTHVVVTNVLGDTTIIVTNVVASGSSPSPDILAGNPFWLTNTAFAVNWDDWHRLRPQPRLQYPSLSFVELMSVMMAQRTVGKHSPIKSFTDYYSSFGADPLNSAINWKGTGLTWYDWIADAWKSNFVADASYNRLLLNALANLSNEVNTTGEYLVNRLTSSSDDTNFYLSNLVNVATAISPDILAGNPWWATNSSFAGVYEAFHQVAPGVQPYQFLQNGTFPQVFSAYLSMRQKQARPSSPFQNLNLYDLWGVDGDNFTRHEVWTFEDWLAEYLKSNMVLTSVSSFSNLVSDASSSGATMEDENVETNALDELTIEQADTDAIGDLTSVVDSMGVEDAFSGVHVSSANPVLRIFDGGQYGSVRVAPVDADFSLPQSVANLMKSISKWLWRLLCVVSIFCIVRQEFDFWSTLGGSAGA